MAREALFTETGEGGGATYAVYLRKTDGSPAVRLGDGLAFGLSPDAKTAASARVGDLQPIILLPTGCRHAEGIAGGWDFASGRLFHARWETFCFYGE